MSKENQEATTVAIVEKNITDSVLVKVRKLQERNSLTLPSDYSPENALKSAFLAFQDMNLSKFTDASVANSLLNMVTQGLNPAKLQCYFIPYGPKLTMQRSYMGSIALAKRVGGLKKITAKAIFEGDIIEIINNVDGTTSVNHQTKFENKDNEIVGAYAIIVMDDGTITSDIMTIKQIKASWSKSKMQTNNVTKQFPEEMAKRTIYNRACKVIIASSGDGNLKDEFTEKTHRDTIQQTVDDNLDNAETIDIEDAEVVENVEVSEEDEMQLALDAENAEAIKEGEGGKGQVKAKF